MLSCLKLMLYMIQNKTIDRKIISWKFLFNSGTDVFILLNSPHKSIIDDLYWHAKT